MDWTTYRKAKEIEKNMQLLSDLAEHNIKLDDKNPFWPLYCFLNGREDFKEYIKKVYNELREEFSKL